MKNNKSSLMKKLSVGIMLAALCVSEMSSFAAGLITTNFSAGTNVIWTGRKSVYQIDVYSGTANIAKFYDTSSNALTYVIGSYVASSNVPGKYLTNLQTNGIFEYAAATYYLIQTNVSLTGAYRTNYTVPQTTNGVPVAATLFLPAAGSVSLEAIDLNFVNGITVTLTNSAQITIYTRD